MDFTALTFTNVSRHFGRRNALNRVSFTCAAGEIVALLGPNGAGKSTLLAVASTLLAPSSGDVRYGEHSLRPDPALRRQIGLLGHDLYLYPELSAAENLTFFGRMYGLDGIQRRVGARSSRAPAWSTGADQVVGFRRGMRQRLRSSARCCTSRGWSSSTSRSRASTTRPRAPCVIACGSSASADASSC